MVSVKGSLLGELVGNGFEVCGYNGEVFEVSSDSYSSRSYFSSSINLLATKGSSDLLEFLSQLPENMGENVATLMVDPAAKTGTSMGDAPRPKKYLVLKEKRLPSPITLPRYTWVDGEVGSYFS